MYDIIFIQLCKMNGFWAALEQRIRMKQFPVDYESVSMEFKNMFQDLPCVVFEILETHDFDAAYRKIFTEIVQPIVRRSLQDSSTIHIQKLLFSFTCSIMYVAHYHRCYRAPTLHIEEVDTDTDSSPYPLIDQLSLQDIN